jgi:hypothetical protein
MQKTGTQKKQIDVLILTENREGCALVLSLLADKELTFSVLSLEQFYELENRLELIGTAVLDAANISADHQSEFERIIGILDSANIAVILLNNWTGPAVEKFGLLTQLESNSIEELWGRISTNISYRRKIQSQRPAATTGRTQPRAGIPAAAEELHQQLEMAGRVQRDFLPTKLPSSDKLRWEALFLPAQCVSGDIYDVARLDEHHIGFYIADAAGHSMPAALLTMFLKNALVMRETTGNHYRIFAPTRVLENLNIGITEQHLSGCQFATCCYCLLNTQDLQLTFARAGHPYPILIRKSQKPQQLKTRGSLLGIFPGAHFVQKTIQLQKGDKLLLYSDGAEPAVGSANEVGQFIFDKNFNQIKDTSIEKMMQKFQQLITNDHPELAEFDDITAVGLEIL